MSPFVFHSKTRRIARCCCCAIWGVLVLVLVSTADVSTATRQQPRTSNHGGNFATTRIRLFGVPYKYARYAATTLRGGSTTIRSTTTVTTRGTTTILQQQPPGPPPPMQGEQQQQHHQHYPQQPPHREGHEKMLPQQQQQLQQLYEERHDNPMAFLPKIGLKQITKALLHTSAWNRKLLLGVQYWGSNGGGSHRLISPRPLSFEQQQEQQVQYDTNSNANFYEQSFHQQQEQQLVNCHQHYGSHPVNVHPSRTWQPPIEATSGRSFEEEELTLFHAKKPRSTSLSRSEGAEYETSTNDNYITTAIDNITATTGAEREAADAQSWGPDLLPYLKHITELLDIDSDADSSQKENGIELFLAMVYLDRACSVETPRSNGVRPCPFCEPRTIHRLGLAAMVVAKKATSVGNHYYGEEPEHFWIQKLSSSLGMPQEQLQQMVEWMIAALGDDGLYVNQDELRTWSGICESFLGEAN